MTVTPEDEQVLAHLREEILEVAGEQIARIIVYGSRVLGTARPDSDLDLMILHFGEEFERELRTDLQKTFHDAAPYPVNVWFRSERHYEESKHVIGGLTYAPHQHGIVVYRHPDSPRDYDNLRSREEVREEFTRFWLRRAQQYIDTGRLLLDRESADYGFAAVQRARWAAEWFIRGLFAARQVDIEKTHNFAELREHVRQIDPELAERLAVADPLTRYPRDRFIMPEDEWEVPEPEAREALRRAERVGEAVRAWVAM